MSNKEEFEKKFKLHTKLKELILADGSVKSDLPKKIGISHDTFYKIANHGMIPTAGTLIRIADYFDVSMEFLLSRTDDDNFCPSTENKNFYDRIVELRLAKGIKTDYALAKATYLPKQYFYDWRKFHYLPTIETLEYLADFFKVTVDYLLGRTDDK